MLNPLLLFYTTYFRHINNTSNDNMKGMQDNNTSLDTLSSFPHLRSASQDSSCEKSCKVEVENLRSCLQPLQDRNSSQQTPQNCLRTTVEAWTECCANTNKQNSSP